MGINMSGEDFKNFNEKNKSQGSASENEYTDSENQYTNNENNYTKTEGQSTNEGKEQGTKEQGTKEKSTKKGTTYRFHENGVDVETDDEKVYKDFLRRQKKAQKQAKQAEQAAQNTGLSDLTKNLFGDKVTPDELGRHIYGENYDPKKHTKVYYETNQAHAHALGEFIASHQDDLSNDYKKGTKRKRVADFNKILPGDENTATRYEMEVGFNKKMESINYRREVDKAFTSVNKETEKARKEYIDKLSKMSPELRGKIYNGGVLTDAEKQELSDLQQEFKTIQGKYDKVAEQFDTEPEKFFAYKKGENGKPNEYANYNKTYNDFQGKVKQVGGNINDITVSDDGHVVFNTPQFEKTILNNEEELKDMSSKAMSTAMGKWSNEADYKDYRSVFDSQEEGTINNSYQKLLDLEKQGVDLSDDAKEVLINKAAALKGNVNSDDIGLINVDKNAETISSRYGISNENVQFLSNNSDGVSLNMDSDGKVTFSNDTLSNMTDAEKEKYKNFKGTEDLADLDNSLKSRKYMSDTKTNNNFKGTDDEFLEDINKKWKDSKDATSKYGLTKAEQFKEMGASDEMIEKLNKGEKLTGQDVKGFKFQKFDESYVELAKMDEDVMDTMIHEYQKDLSDINSINPKDKKSKAKAIYDDVISKKASSLNDISDDFEFNLDVSDEKAVRKFLENINANRTTGDQIDVAKMMSEYVTKNKSKNTKLNIGSIIDAYSNNGTTGVNNLIKDTNDKNAKDMFNKAFDKVIGILEKSDNEDLKNLGGHFKKMARDDNFTKDVIEKTAFKEAVNKAPEFKSLKDGKGMEIAKKAMGNKYIKGAALVAGAVGIGAMAIGAMNNAAEERERKRQEMNMLIASQNSSIRGGY